MKMSTRLVALTLFAAGSFAATASHLLKNGESAVAANTPLRHWSVQAANTPLRHWSVQAANTPLRHWSVQAANTPLRHWSVQADPQA